LDSTLLQENTPVLLDFGAKVRGYHADITRTIWFGDSPSVAWKKAYQTVLQAKQQAEEYLNDNETPDGNKADQIAKDIISQAGYQPYPHSLGHGVGLEIHENPRLSLSRSDTIKPEMVFTVEPAVYVADSFGIRLEDTVVKTVDGIIHLTTSPFLNG
jgi:Xaa-Pro aminopeptidase